MPKQTMFGVNYNMLTRQGTAPYNTQLYAGANPLDRRLRSARIYDCGVGAFTAGSKERNLHDSGYCVWGSTNAPGTFRAVTSGTHDAFYTQLFRDMHAWTWGGNVSGSVSGASFGGTRPTFMMWTPDHEADRAGKGTNSEYRQMWSHLRVLLLAVHNSGTYNPGGVKRVQMTTCPTAFATHFGASGWQPTSASEVDICGYDKYFPSVGPNLVGSAGNPPYVDGSGASVNGQHLEALRTEANNAYGADMPMAIGEIGVSVEGTTDPNRLSLQSLRYRWFADSNSGLAAYLKNTRLPNGEPKFVVVNYFVIGFPTNPTPPSEVAQGFQGGWAWRGFKETNAALTDTGVTAILPPTPGATTSITSSSCVLQWTNPTGSVGTRVYEGATPVGGQLAASSTSVAVVGMAPGSVHAFTLKAVAADGTLSAASTVINVTLLASTDTIAPTVPASLRLSGTPATTSFAVAWNASTDSAPGGVTPSGLAGYRLYVGGVKNGADILPGILTRSVTGLTANTVYSVRVTAFDNAGNESAQSSALSVTTAAAGDTSPPSTPTNVTALVLSAAGAYGASWSASSDNVAVAGYRVRVGGVVQSGTVTATTWQGSGAVGQSHTFEVQAIDTAGLVSAFTAPLTLIGAGGNTAPTPVVDFIPDSFGPAPFTLVANLSGSSDPNGGVLTYTYKWGDGSPDTLNSASAQLQHTYVDSGSYAAKFGVRDPGGLYSEIAQTVTVTPGGGGGTALFGLTYAIAGEAITADAFNILLDQIDAAVNLASGGAGSLVSRWDAEAILQSGALPSGASNVLPPGIEVPYDTTLQELRYAVGTPGLGSGSTQIACKYAAPDGVAVEIPSSRVTVVSGAFEGAVGGLQFQMRAGGNLTFDIVSASATPASDLRVHAFGA